MVASEMAPFARSGALADTLHCLPSALQKRGHKVSVILPLYRSVLEQKQYDFKKTGVRFSVSVGEAQQECEVFEARAENGVQIFFIRRDEFFDRSGLYGNEGRDYQDNSARFIFFSKCAVELARRLTPSPDLVHGHDWQCGMIPVYSKFRNLPFPHVLTVHELSFQGNFWSCDFALTNLPPDYFSPGGVEFYGSLNFLKAGMLFSDQVVFPSEMFISDAMQTGHGCGMEALIQELRDKMVGIPEGVDNQTWNPAEDPSLPVHFSGSDIAPKSQCRTVLLEKLALRADPKGPVVAMVTRLFRDKGFDILLPALDRILSTDCRLIILGKGEPEYEVALKSASKRHAGRLTYLCEQEGDLSRFIFGGADILLAPARLESSGVRVMQALRYGVVPVVRASGGLRQIVEDFDPATEQGNGFVFYQFSADALLDSLRRACELYPKKQIWEKLMHRGMTRNFSWDGAAERHERMYQSLLGI